MAVSTSSCDSHEWQQCADTCRPRVASPMSALRKTENLKFCRPAPPRHPRPPSPRAGPRPDSPAQAARFSVSRAVSASVSRPPCQAQTGPLRADLEQVVAGRNFRFPVFQIFGRARVKFREHTPNNNQRLPRVETRRIHFVCHISGWVGDVRVQFGFGSISGGLIRCPRWRFTMKWHKIWAYFG
jgi:hypothetical protein